MLDSLVVDLEGSTNCVHASGKDNEWLGMTTGQGVGLPVLQLVSILIPNNSLYYFLMNLIEIGVQNSHVKK